MLENHMVIGSYYPERQRPEPDPDEELDRLKQYQMENPLPCPCTHTSDWYKTMKRCSSCGARYNEQEAEAM